MSERAVNDARDHAHDPRDLAADGDEVPEGAEPPTLETQLAHLHAAGWPPA